MSDMTDETQVKLKALGYSVVDASNPVVEYGWLMRAPGAEDRAWIAASEAEAWQMAHHHHSQARTNNTDGAALLPVTQSDGDLTLALIDSLECSTDAPDAPEWAAKFREELADRGFIIARHATQEDAERSGADVDTVAKIIDPDAWHETLPTDGCGAYWIGRRNDARAKASSIRVALAKGAASHE